MLRIDESSQPASFLRVGDDVQHQRRFAGGLRPKNLHHPPSRQPSHPQRQIHRKRARGNDVDLFQGVRVTQAHDAPFAVGFGDAGDGRLQLALPGWIDP